MSTTPRHTTRALSGLAVGALALALAGCGTSGTDSSGASASGSKKLEKTIVFSPLTLKAPALKGLADALNGYATSQGWKVIVQDPNFDPTKQNQGISEVLDSGRAGAAWVIAVAPKSMGGTIKSAQAKGVPILVNGRPQEYGYNGAQPGVSFSYIDYTAGGKALGDQLGKCLTAKNGGKGQVIFNQSTPGQAGKAEFEAAAAAALKAAAPGSEIVQKLSVADRSTGQTAIGNALQGHPDLAGVMSSTDEGALGAAGAFDAANKKLVCNVDFGGNAEVLKDVKSGAIYSSVALQFGADMKQSFDTLKKMQSDPKSKGKVLITPQKIIASGS
jgi:ABC-type sugar transport system substrate-binding protein